MTIPIISEIVPEIDLIQEICQAFKVNKNANVYLYLNCQVNDSNNIYTPKKVDDNIIKKFDCNINKFTIRETTFRDLIKINRDNMTMFAKKYSSGKLINDNLLVCTYFTEINAEMFPFAESGLHTETKIIQILDFAESNKLKLKLTKLMLINDVFCIEIKQKPSSSSEKKELRKEITNIINYVHL